ncbi:MAG: family 20 glycosylhydrolase [Bacteroidales bacterium]|nr:family 20 glycosylhydrolase [Bacteroidales bacterium]
MRTLVIQIIMVITILSFFSCKKQKSEAREIVLLPRPVLMEQRSGVFKLDSSTVIHVTDNPRVNETAKLFAEMIEIPAGYKLAIDNNINSSKGIILDLTGDVQDRDGAYSLEINRRKVHISASSPEGIFYGIQTVRQLFPPEFESSRETDIEAWEVPCVYIEDYPRFSWRGMHLDVSRHFFPVEFVKRYIDLIAMHKMNIFHWHLVDDQGWRIEIKKYPKLTGIGAWRVDREDQPWNAREPQKPGETATYGGYYTQDDIRDIVKYAQDRYITVVPEIEMPAHVTSALAAYPEYSCTGGPFTVPPGGLWPIKDIYCAGKDETFEFLEDILTEVMDLFPSEYIHIGGDEADKTEWERCPDCQARIKQEGLKDEAELQSYFIKRIENFLSSNDRKLIGWDEILEGGLAPGAAVMSWRGMSGGIEAAHSGHYVVMSPGTHCYFDHYQADPSTEPKAIGGYTTLKKVYSFDPVPDALSEDEQKYIMGAQANLWTEYISDGDHAEYMVLPRMTALAEVLWLPEEKLDWKDFSRRVHAFFKRFDIMGLNYSRGSYSVNMEAVYDQEQGTVEVSMEAEFPEAGIHYTLDGSEPGFNSEIYIEPLALESTTTIKAAVFAEDSSAGKISEKTVYIHKATGRDVNYAVPYSDKYKAFDELTLVNGIKGSLNFADGQWQGFEGNDLDITIDLGEITEVSSASVSFLSSVGSWVFLPEFVLFQVSEDGVTFTDFGKVENDLKPREQDREIKEFAFDGEARQARYLRVWGKSIIECPEWHAGAGDKVWIFSDEVIIR